MKNGKILREEELASTPEAIGMFLLGTGLKIRKVGLESGNLAHYLKKGLMEMNYEVVVMESRKMLAILAVTINKTDKNDGRGIADALRVGHYKECVHRSDESLEIRTLLHGRGTLVNERTHLVSSIRGHLKVYGIKLGKDRSFKEQVEENRRTLSFETGPIEHLGIGIPILWTVLDKAGTSSTTDRTAILERVIKAIGKNNIRILLADREFIGEVWFRFLIEHEISFVIRLKQNFMVYGLRNGYALPIVELVKRLGIKKALINQPVTLWKHCLFASVEQAKAQKRL